MKDTCVRCWAERARMPLGLVCLAVSAAACSSVARETIDRVTPHDSSAWTSPSDCEELFAGRAVSSRNPRVATWNIRYFPDSVEGEQTNADEATDVSWVACAIASLDVDILVVQEFKNTDAALEKQQELIAGLDALTGGDWQLELDQCTPAEVQHPGFLFDKTRVSGESFREIPSMNPDPVCSNQVSPGFGGYFSIDGGPDFHLIAVHGQTGAGPESLEKRAFITAAMESVATDAYAINPDTDIVFAGDFNSAGCDSCDPVLSNTDEVAELGGTIASFHPSLMLLPTTEECSRVAEDVPLIDHVITAASMAEVPENSIVHVSGICEEISCGRQVNWLEDAYDRLSDHCPLILDLAPMDDD